MARSTKARVPKATSSKTRLPKYLKTDNIIEVSSDGVEDGSPSTQNGGARRPMRSTRNQASPPLYNAKYHPMDEVTRPVQAAKRRKAEIKEQTISSGEESSEDTLEELESIGHEHSDDDQSSPPQRKPSEGTRHSGRQAALKRVSYDPRVHPQDKQLEELGIKRKRITKKGVIADSEESEVDGDSDEEIVQVKPMRRDSKQPNDREDEAGKEAKVPSQTQLEESNAIPLTFERLSRISHLSSTPVLQERYAEPVDVHRLPSGKNTFAHYRDSLVNKDDAGSIETQSTINVLWESGDGDGDDLPAVEYGITPVIRGRVSDLPVVADDGGKGPNSVAKQTTNVPSTAETDIEHSITALNPSSGSSRTLGGDPVMDRDVLTTVTADSTVSRQENLGGPPPRVAGDGVMTPADAGDEKANEVPTQTSMEDEIATGPSNALPTIGDKDTATAFSTPSLGASVHEERGVSATIVAKGLTGDDGSQATCTSSQSADAVVEAALNAAESLAFLNDPSATARTQNDTVKGMSVILRQKPQHSKCAKKIVGFVIHEDPKTPEKSGGLPAARRIFEDFEQENTPRSPDAFESPLRPHHNPTSMNGNNLGQAEHSNDTTQELAAGDEGMASLQPAKDGAMMSDEYVKTPAKSSDAATVPLERFAEEMTPNGPPAGAHSRKVDSLFGPYEEDRPQSRPLYAEGYEMALAKLSRGHQRHDDMPGEPIGVVDHEDLEDLFDGEGTSGLDTSSQSNHFEEAIAAGSDPSSELNHFAEGVLLKESQEL